MLLNQASWHNSHLPFIYHPVCIWAVIKRAGRTSQRRREVWDFTTCLPGLLTPICTWTAEGTRKYFMSLNYTVTFRVSWSVPCNKLQITIQKVVNLNMNIEITFYEAIKVFLLSSNVSLNHIVCDLLNLTIQLIKSHKTPSSMWVLHTTFWVHWRCFINYPSALCFPLRRSCISCQIPNVLEIRVKRNQRNRKVLCADRIQRTEMVSDPKSKQSLRKPSTNPAPYASYKQNVSRKASYLFIVLTYKITTSLILGKLSQV